MKVQVRECDAWKRALLVWQARDLLCAQPCHHGRRTETPDSVSIRLFKVQRKRLLNAAACLYHYRDTTVAATAQSATGMQTKGCPFAAAASSQNSDVSICPMAARFMPSDEAGASGGPATCPLGFGSAKGPKLSTLHCPVCKGLLFDAHSVTSCKHTFCRSCITQTRDCPSCGRDVDGLEANTELAGEASSTLRRSLVLTIRRAWLQVVLLHCTWTARVQRGTIMGLCCQQFCLGCGC